MSSEGQFPFEQPLPATLAGQRARQGRWVLPLALLSAFAGALVIYLFSGPHWMSLFIIGLGLGLTLYHAAFGFASSWRRFLLSGEGRAMRAQFVMLALASLAFFPILAEGEAFGRPVVGAIAPAGLSVAVGSFLFGIGMQLAGGCASGTLYSLGGGSKRMIVVLLFFIAGSLAGSAHLPFWLEVAKGDRFSLVTSFGLSFGLSIQIAVLAILIAFTLWLERKRGVIYAGSNAGGRGLSILLRGPWPLYLGAVILAALNILTLVVAQHPWSVSFGYTLWGAKAASWLGVDLSSWAFWSWPFPKRALAGSLFENSTSVMNFGIILGAFLAAGLAGRFGPKGRLLPKQVLAAVLGGLLMGYGARLAFGCNIGAYFSGVASGSLHGWLWFVCALAGTFLGLHLRPYFQLSKL